MLDQCTGVFTKTMGLPCWHTIRQFHLTEQEQPVYGIYKPPICSTPLRIDQIHSHWHLRLPSPLHFGGAAPQILHPPRTVFPTIVENLMTFYDSAPAHQQAATERQIAEIVAEGVTSHILNPAVVVGKGRPKGSKNKKSICCDPSEFEVSAPSHHCDSCSELIRHNARTCLMRIPSSTVPQ